MKEIINKYVNESKNIRVQDFYLRIRTKFAVVLLHRTKNYMRYLAKIYEKYFPNVIHCKVWIKFRVLFGSPFYVFGSSIPYSLQEKATIYENWIDEMKTDRQCTMLT